MDIRPKVITQHCIQSHFFDEVMRLPKEVKIISIHFEVGFAIKRLSREVPVAMEACGVTRIAQSDPSVEVVGKLVGSRDKMKANVKTICKETGLNPQTVRVKRMEIAIGKNDKSHASFYRMTKKIPDSDDKISSVVVLGLTKWDGDEMAIAKACHTSTYRCKFDTQTIRTVLCEEG